MANNKLLISKITTQTMSITVKLKGLTKSGRPATKGEIPYKYKGRKLAQGKVITVTPLGPYTVRLESGSSSYDLRKHLVYNYYVGYCNNVLTKVVIGKLTTTVTYWPATRDYSQRILPGTQ